MVHARSAGVCVHMRCVCLFVRVIASPEWMFVSIGPWIGAIESQGPPLSSSFEMTSVSEEFATNNLTGNNFKAISPMKSE